MLVGHLWLAVHDRVGYLYDIEVLPDARGRGLGRASMRAAEDAARDLGADLLRLNVFGHNAVARGLYERLGYDVVRAVHTRTLAPQDARERPAELVLTRPVQVNPGHEVWTATGDGRGVGSACLHWVREGAGLRVEAHDLRAPGTEPALLLRALVGLAAQRGAEALAAEAGDLPGGAGAFAAAGFTLTAELREKVLARA